MKTLRNLFIVAVAIMPAVGGCGKSSQNQNTGQTDQTGQTNQAAQVEQPSQGNQAASQGSQPSQGSAPASRPSRSSSKEMTMTIPDSTQLNVTISEMVQTNENHVGDVFTGEVASPIIERGMTVIPQGTVVHMVITRLVKGGTLKTTPEIAFTIRDLTLPNGSTYQVNSSEIYEGGRSHTKREVGMIGGGAAAGAIVGGLVGKGKGAVIGAVAGAAAGTGAAAATGRQNLVYKQGQSVTFTLTQPLNVVAQK